MSHQYLSVITGKARILCWIDHPWRKHIHIHTQKKMFPWDTFGSWCLFKEITFIQQQQQQNLFISAYKLWDCVVLVTSKWLPVLAVNGHSAFTVYQCGGMKSDSDMPTSSSDSPRLTKKEECLVTNLYFLPLSFVLSWDKIRCLSTLSLCDTSFSTAVP